MTAQNRRHRLFIANLAITMALFVIGHAVLRSTTDSIMQGIEGLSSETILVGDQTNGFINSPSGTGLNANVVSNLRAALGSKYSISGAARSFGEVTSNGSTENASTYFIEPNFLDISRIKIVRGRSLSSIDYVTRQDNCLLSMDLAKKFSFPTSVVSDGRPCNVVGLVGSAENIPGQSIRLSVYKPLSVVQNYSENGETIISSIVLRANLGVPTPSDVAAIIEHLPPGSDPENMIWSGQEYWAAKKEVALGLWVLMTSLSIILICMASAGVANSLLIDVMARRAEIGLRVALGATQRDIFEMILREGLRIAIFGGALGAFSGFILNRWVVSPLISSSSLTGQSSIPIDLWSIGIAALVLISSGALAAIIPAQHAIKTDPSLALRNL